MMEKRAVLTYIARGEGGHYTLFMNRKFEKYVLEKVHTSIYPHFNILRKKNSFLEGILSLEHIKKFKYMKKYVKH